MQDWPYLSYAVGVSDAPAGKRRRLSSEACEPPRGAGGGPEPTAGDGTEKGEDAAAGEGAGKSRELLAGSEDPPGTLLHPPSGWGLSLRPPAPPDT